jgi:predicted membrane channel-forming protein YqfA (hemolysin III family)
MKPVFWWWRKMHDAETPQNAGGPFDRFRSRPQVARVLASSVTLLSMLRDAIGTFFRKEGVRRGLLFGLGSFLILGVLILLLVQPVTYSPAQTIMVSVLVLMSVTGMLVMDLFD